VAYEWDAAQASANLRKHGIDFADAVTALEDDLALTMEDLLADGERRWLSLGTDASGRLLLVVYTWRQDSIRLISARPATAWERLQYEEKR
jgi:uncharacterized DUF497 family protein